jgi:YtfJ family uncharacterized protein
VKIFPCIIILIVTCFSLSVSAEPIILGKKLPDLQIIDGGDLYIDHNGQRQFRPWSSSSLRNSKKIIQYMPGRLSSRENLRLNDAVFKLDHPHRCRTISIINFTDAIPGTWIFIEPEMARNKKITPLCGTVLDKSGLGLQRWNLELTKNATIVVNEQGIVEFFYSGRLSDKQIEIIVALTNTPGIKAPVVKE